MVLRSRPSTATLFFLGVLATLCAYPEFAKADRWRVVGISPDGELLAAIAVTIDVERGFHRHSLVLIDVADGHERSRKPLIAAERYRALRARGDYDLLRYERRIAHRRRLSELLAQRYASCRPLAVHEEAPGRFVVRRPSGPLLVSLSNLDPHAAADAGAEGSADGAPNLGFVSIESAGDAAPRIVGKVPLRVAHPSPWETILFPLSRLRDALLCGPDELFVALVETADPPQPDLPSEEYLLFQGHAVGASPARADEEDSEEL